MPAGTVKRKRIAGAAAKRAIIPALRTRSPRDGATSARASPAILRAPAAFAGALLALALGACASMRSAEDAPRAALFQVERAFARAAAERGMRDAFLEYFADDAVSFEPQPVDTRRSLLERPAPADPLANRLEWQPAIGAVARAGDLGFTMGPYTFTQRASGATSHGVYFSIWTKTPDGWRVALDAGSATPLPMPLAAFGDNPALGAATGAVDARAERSALLGREREPWRVNVPGPGVDVMSVLAPDVRVKRDDAMLVIGTAALAHLWTGEHRVIDETPIDGRVSASGDLAYTYGRYTSREAGLADRDSERGYYVHLWLRDASGRWRIAYLLAMRSTAQGAQPSS